MRLVYDHIPSVAPEFSPFLWIPEVATVTSHRLQKKGFYEAPSMGIPRVYSMIS